MIIRNKEFKDNIYLKVETDGILYNSNSVGCPKNI